MQYVTGGVRFFNYCWDMFIQYSLEKKDLTTKYEIIFCCSLSWKEQFFSHIRGLFTWKRASPMACTQKCDAFTSHLYMTPFPMGLASLVASHDDKKLAVQTTL